MGRCVYHEEEVQGLRCLNQRCRSVEEVLKATAERMNTATPIMQMVREVRELAPPIVQPMMWQRIGSQERDSIAVKQNIAIVSDYQLSLAEIVFLVDFQEIALSERRARLQGSRQQSQFCQLRELQMESRIRCEVRTIAS